MTQENVIEKPLAPSTPSERRKALGRLVDGRIRRIQEGYCSGSEPTAASKATLAQLRQALQRSKGDVIIISQETLVPDELYWRVPSPSTEEPTREELAVHTAMTLYAVHQQSRTDKRLHELKKDQRSETAAQQEKTAQPDGKSKPDNRTRPGEALGMLVNAEKTSSEAMRRRFNMIMTAASFDELLNHLKTMVRLLRDNRIAMDYAQLTEDLFQWQYQPNRNHVLLQWSRDFERTIATSKSDSKGENE